MLEKKVLSIEEWKEKKEKKKKKPEDKLAEVIPLFTRYLKRVK